MIHTKKHVDSFTCTFQLQYWILQQMSSIHLLIHIYLQKWFVFFVAFTWDHSRHLWATRLTITLAFCWGNFFFREIKILITIFLAISFIDLEPVFKFHIMKKVLDNNYYWNFPKHWIDQWSMINNLYNHSLSIRSQYFYLGLFIHSK